jgi:photosystem II stability/assembly factor-like uncharacterized protein
MTPEERELRRALNARSDAPSAEFRARLSGVLAEGKPASNVMPAVALVAALVLVFATVGVLLLARQARSIPPPGAAHSPRASATPTPTPPFTPGVLNKPPAPIVLPANAQLSAPSSNVVWALVVDQYLYRSTNRGATWQQRPLPPSQAFCPQAASQCPFPQPGISFVSDQEGWLTTGGSPAAQCNSKTIALWHTTDAGATWQLLGSNSIAAFQCDEGLSFVDSNRGFLDSWPLIYRTTDSGRTWTGSQPLNPPGFNTGYIVHVGLVRAFGSTLLVSVQRSSASALYVFRSTDGGATWNYLASAKDPNNNVVFVTASRWLELIAPGQSVETTDSGASWHPYGSDYSQAAPIAADFVFGDSLVGYGTVRGGINRTLDGGLHWTSIKTPGT